MSDSNYILELCLDCLKFDLPSSGLSIFFDDTNCQILIPRYQDSNGILVKSFASEFHLNLNLDPRDEIISLKLSPTFDILAMQTSSSSVSFFNFSGENPTNRYSQMCKNKNSRIIGFVWTSGSEIVFITDSGIEFYQIVQEKGLCKLLKIFSLSINWFIYQSSSSTLIVSSGSTCNIFQPFLFRSSSMIRLTRFEVDCSKNKLQRSLFEKDCTLVNLYGKTCLLVFKHEAFTREDKGSHILIYTLQKEGPATKSYILRLGLTGKFAVNVVDDLIIVHHQTSQTSLLFDIRSPSSHIISKVTHLFPLVPPYTIKPFRADDTYCELYSTHWKIYQPNLIMDAKAGYLWRLQINLLPICRMMSNESQLFDFLILRKNSKPVILNFIKETILMKRNFGQSTNRLEAISFLFNKLNSIYKESSKISSNDISTKDQFESKNKSSTRIDQSDMFATVFCVFFDVHSEGLDENFAISVLFEYIKSLHQCAIKVEYFIYELLINVLVRGKKYYQLHQFLQYFMLKPRNHLACLLLSLQPQYPYAEQLALDMFKKLPTPHDDIIEVFLSRGELLRALRLIQTHGNIESVSARKFLDLAAKSKDNRLFFEVFRFFEERNLRMRGSPAFIEGEHCEPFVKLFEELFNSTTSL